MSELSERKLLGFLQQMIHAKDLIDGINKKRYQAWTRQGWQALNQIKEMIKKKIELEATICEKNNEIEQLKKTVRYWKDKCVE